MIGYDRTSGADLGLPLLCATGTPDSKLHDKSSERQGCTMEPILTGEPIPEITPSDGERLDRVNHRLLLLQKKSGQLFSTDALLLAGYLRPSSAVAAELGSGSGIVSLLALTRDKAAEIDAFELQPAYAALTERNAALNRLSHRLRAVRADVREESLRRHDRYEAVFANPPYMPAGGRENADPEKTAARHEVFGGVAAFAEAAGRMLRTGGLFTAVCRPDRTVDLLSAMRNGNIEPKRLTPVLPKVGAAPCLILVEGKKGAKPSLYLTPVFCLKDADGQDSEEYRFLLENGSFPGVYMKKM